MAITVEGPGGATVEFPDGTSADTINSVMAEHFGGGSKQEASGVVAGANHGLMELLNGPLETAKRVAGAGPGRMPEDKSYVPANVTHGSFNPLKWDLTQLPQKVAEIAPSAIPDVAAGYGGAKLGKKIGGVKGAALGALLGAALSGTARTAGDTVKDVTVARTGDENAESSPADVARGVATAGAASLAGSVLPARLVPGMGTLRNVGATGALDAFKRYLGTAAAGGAGAVGSDAITQVGSTIGTDKGLTVDPARFPEAFVGGTATGATLAAPKFGFDTKRATSLREHGGENLDATKNYATRLNEEGQGKLGDKLIGAGHFDQEAHDNAVFGIQRELSDAAKSVRKQLPGLSEDAHTALAKAESNKKLSTADIDLLDKELASAPDGANASYLARTMRMSQLAAERGQNGGKSGWTGGISGIADANVGYMLNPFRMATGAAMSLGGFHLLGMGSPWAAGTALGLYGAARIADSAMGTRSPAKTYAEHFADMNAQLRKPTGPMSPPQGPQPQGPIPNGPWNPAPPRTYGPTGTVTGMGPAQVPQGPWGPKPLPTTAVPQVQQTAPAAPQPAMSPIAMAMLKQSLKQGLPPDTTQQAQPAAPDPINPLALPRDITTPAKNVVNGMMLAQKLKQEAQAKDAVASLPSPLMDEAPLDVTRNPLIGKRAGQLVSAAKALQKYTGADVEAKEAAQAERAEAQAAKDQARAEQKQQTEAQRAQAKAEAARARAEKAEAAVAKAKDKEAAKAELVKAKAEAAKAKEAAKLEMAKVKAAASLLKQATVKSAPEKISKANGKFKAKAEEAEAAPFMPKMEEDLYPRGITPEQYAHAEADGYLGPHVPKARRDNYIAEAKATEYYRAQTINELQEAFSGHAKALEIMHRQMQKAGGSSKKLNQIRDHYAELLSRVDPKAGNAVREAFK